MYQDSFKIIFSCISLCIAWDLQPGSIAETHEKTSKFGKHQIKNYHKVLHLDSEMLIKEKNIHLIHNNFKHNLLPY